MRAIADFRLLNDQILVEPIRKLERFESQRNGLFLANNPERDKQREFYHLGRVVKCGPGDSVREGSKIQDDGSRIAYAAPREACENCDCVGSVWMEDLTGDGVFGNVDCPVCDGKGTLPGRWPMHVKEGDIILYERRPWAVVELDGRQFLVLHEEQHCIAVLDEYTGDQNALEYDPTLDRLVA
jgi:co-chaperonin GroES (HSP10)